MKYKPTTHVSIKQIAADFESIDTFTVAKISSVTKTIHHVLMTEKG